MGAPGKGDVGQKLLKLKEQLEGQKSRRDELQGEYNSLMKQLQQEFGLEDLEQAQTKLEEMDSQIQEMEKSLQQQAQEIERLMEGSE